MRVLLILLGAVLLAGCGEDEEPATKGGGSLEGVAWVLTSGVDVEGVQDVAPTATFEGGRLSGFSGCNNYTTSYELDGDSIQIGQVAANLMACPFPGDAVQTAYLGALAEVARWQVDGDELTLLDDGGEELLRFSESSLVGAWEATSFLQGDAITSAILDTKVTAVFEDSGALNGNAGCNNYTTSYKLDGANISIEPPGATRKLCTAPEGVMEQEHAYLTALAKAATYTLEGDTLTLLRADGGIAATFVRSP